MSFKWFNKDESINIYKPIFKFRVYFSVGDSGIMDTTYRSHNYKLKSEALKVVREEFHVNKDEEIKILKIIDSRHK